MKKELNATIRGLVRGHLLASLMFSLTFYALYRYWEMELSVVTFFPYALLIFILLQGCYFWYYYSKKIAKRPLDYTFNQTIFKLFRLVNGLLFLAYGIYLISGNDKLSTIHVIAVTFYSLFSLVEYINLYYIRLSYTKAQDIKRLVQFKLLKPTRLRREFFLKR
ncbi:hypothetical protein [Halalkalibacterium halodurans]|uniref:Uncharacterized protein n=1 Tax=Halalkalibacterium halodurans TaxID=86665 RepID=A0A0M0KGP3_ALKHA|nr:hypothetical protein [Halalkalibacterium halodurans]MED4163926.1 hypothetical protein [Halalkalibacterium halodurans]TPE67208.1 hypothetical protein AMD02_017585 [Halalkalibacterium halodurans]